MSENFDRYLFVYGTLMRDSNSDMYHLLSRNSEFYSSGSFCGNLFKVSYYPGAVLSDNKDDKVYGEIYKLSDSKTIMAQLDIYEECGENYVAPTEYIRHKMAISTSDGRLVESWIYLYNRPVESLIQIKSGRFIENGEMNVLAEKSGNELQPA